MQQRNTKWIRLLGRLRRITMEGDNDQSDKARRDSPTSPSPKDEPETNVEPTDPEVYRGSPRQPTPFPQQIRDIPTPALLAALTPTSDLIREILEEIENQGEDVPPSRDRSTPPENIIPAGAESSSPSSSLVHGTYVRMASIFPEGVNASIPLTPPSSSPPRSDPPIRESQHEYDTLQAPRRRNHQHGERAIPIPHGSPPFEQPRPTLPMYYRDYLNPDVMPAYHFICLSAWYVQISPNTIYCKNCVTAEHTFCTCGRYGTVWRHLHVISRTFEHTQLHCGRCYKLLIKSRRAIDCYYCRLTN